MKEIKANKEPIGKTYQPEPFSTHSLPLSLSSLFLFTDGYADQFGGPKGKKFKYSNLQKLLLKNSDLDLETLNLKLSTAFDEWKGELVQVDDVCVIGIRI
jgi:serine phosphatase RsbU (regulator of sigma subunit)